MWLTERVLEVVQIKVDLNKMQKKCNKHVEITEPMKDYSLCLSKHAYYI